MNTYALDTNIVSALLKNNLNVIRAYRDADDSGYKFIIPAAVYYEVRRGLIVANGNKLAKDFEKLCELFDIEQMTIEAWEKAAQIWATLRMRGTPLGKDDGDIFIAAQCIVNDYTLVTNNIKDFKRIKGLKFVNWSEE